MTLLEVLLVTALVGVLFNIAASMFVMSGRVTAMSTIALDRLDGVREVQALFTGAVRGATGVLEEAGGFVSGPDRVVLRTPEGIAVFGRLGESDRVGLIRLEERNGTWESGYLRPLRQRFASITLQVVDGQLVEMDLVVRREAGERRGQPATYRARAGWRGVATAEEVR